jgi:hypothetical protein
VVWRGAAPSNVCAAGPPARALLFLRSEAEQRDRFGVLHSFGVSDY